MAEKQAPVLPLGMANMTAKQTFATLMARARDRTLSQRERLALGRARQQLRRAKRPAMNPTPDELYKTGPFWIVRTSDYPSRYLSSRGLKPRAINAKKFDSYEDARKAGQRFFAGTKQRWQIESRDADFWTPAQNPRRRSGYSGYRPPQEFHGAAYKGYSIQFNALRNEYWIEKNGAFIAYAQTISEAKKSIDAIVGDNPRRRRNPASSNAVVRIGRTEELRYMREIGRKPGPYSHKSGRNARGKIYTVPPGWYYVSKKAVIIAEERPRRR